MAVCDLDVARAQAASAQFAIPHAYGSAQELFARHRLDFVDIATRRIVGWSVGLAESAAGVIDAMRHASERVIEALLDSGIAPGWSRTGEWFKQGGTTAVCRFYGSVSPGPNSHFYTASQSDCDLLRALQAITPATQQRLNFESLDFMTTPATNGTCPANLVPVYRAYNNGVGRGIDGNHRFSTSASAIAEVVARGWVNEGGVMCAPA